MTQRIHTEIKLDLLDEIFHLPAFMINPDNFQGMSRQVCYNKGVLWAQLIGIALNPANHTAGFVLASGGLVSKVMIEAVVSAVICPIGGIKFIVSRSRTS